MKYKPTSKIKIGDRYGRLKVVSFSHSDKRNKFWKCLCDCGNIKIERTARLNSGHTKSCGCLWKDVVIKHGKSTTRLYRIWLPLIRNNKLCKEWENLNVFSKWAYKNGYNETNTIARKDKSICYSPFNCEVVTLQEAKKRSAAIIFITHKGITKTITEWAKEIGISHQALRLRLDEWGSIEKCLTVPKKANKWNTNLKE